MAVDSPGSWVTLCSMIPLGRFLRIHRRNLDQNWTYFKPLLSRVEWFFFIGQKMVLNQRSGIIPSPILNFRWRSARAAKFSFSKIPGGLNINIFLWKFAWCFLLHKRTNPEKQIWNLSFKTTILDPEKACFCFFKKIPKLFFFFVFWLWLSFKNNRCTIDFLVSIFKISLQKSY